MKIKAIIFITICFLSSILMSISQFSVTKKYIPSVNTSYVTFVSDAPLEYITATSKLLVGVIDTSSQSFAFKMPMSSFNGFNSKLQKEHFEENYLEIEKYPSAKFVGKIIEDVNFGVNGDYVVRTKGGMEIHGISKEQIFKCNLNIKNGVYTIVSEFPINLNDYNIHIPQLVKEKIAENLKVNLKIIMK